MNRPAEGSDGNRRTDRAWIVAVTLTGIVAGIASGWLAIALTRPSADELQRAALDEVGLPGELESAPMIGPALDAYTNRIEARVIDESRPSATAGLAIGVTVSVSVTTAATAAAGRIRARMAPRGICPSERLRRVSNLEQQETPCEVDRA